MSLIQLQNKFYRNLRDYGWAVSLKKSLAYLYRPVFYRRSWLITQNDLAHARISQNADTTCSFRFLRSNDSSAIRQIEGWEEWLQGRVKPDEKQMCLVAMSQSRLVGFYLIALREYDLSATTVRVRLARKEAWGVQISVRKDYRRMGLATRLRGIAYAELRDRCLEKLFGYIAPNNVASLSSAKKAGAAVLGTLTFARVCNRNKLEYHRTAPLIGGRGAGPDPAFLASSTGRNPLLIDSSQF